MGSLFSSPKVDAPKNDIEEAPSPLSKRGSFVPLLIGTYRVAPIVAWVGDRKSKSVKSGGKGTGAAGGGSRTRHFWESGWHLLCVGPASKLHKIYENGELLYDPTTPLDPIGTPSGSTITPGKSNKGSFKIYWGEDTQPVNTDLGTSMGISSRWPRICYIHWIKKKIGTTSPRWPSLEYVISTELDEAPTPLVATPNVLGNGINPAHALKQIATAPFPYGCGMDESFLNNVSLEALGTLMQTEGVAFNILAKEGITGTKVVKDMMEDMGVLLSPYQYDLVAVPVRNNPAVTTFSDDVLLPPDPELEYDTGVTSPNRVVFTFKDAAKGYNDTDIPFDDDSSISLRNATKPKTVKMNSVTTHAEASVVAKRRRLKEASDPIKYKIKATRDSRALRPGQAILFSGMEVLRVGAITLKDRSGEVTLETAVDLYGVDPEQYTIPAPISDPAQSNAAQDLAFTFYELPPDLTNEIAIAVIRIRAHDQITGASIWASADNATYSDIADHETNASGGTLDANFFASDNTIIESGPLITLTGGDTDTILDLSGDENNWRTGKQLCLINDEVFFLRNITALGGSSYQLNGLIRARYGSVRASHTSGDQVFIFAQQDISPIKNTLIQPGLPLYIKTQPFTSSGVVDLGTVTPVQKLITGKIYRPLPMDNFRGNELNTYTPGDGVAFSWTYRVLDGEGSAAGEQVAGDAISATKPPPDGYFEIAITGGRTITVTDDSGTVQYTNAEIVMDFGGEPASITATLKNIKGSYITSIPSLIVARDTSQSTVDTTPPTPDPMTFATDPAPDATDPTESIKMTATTAADASGVDYFFEITSGPGNDSGWQSSATYTDSGLRPNTEYKYRVRTRDQSPLQNLSGWSAEKAALTDQPAWKGNWATATFYAKGDSVEQLGTSYTCILAHTSSGSTIPPNGTYWEVLAQKGTDGAAGATGATGSTGAEGPRYEFAYKESATAPSAPPTDNQVVPTGWLASPPVTPSLQVWVTKAKFQDTSTILTAWTTPAKWDGQDGADGTNGTDGIDGLQGWSTTIDFTSPAVDKVDWSTGTIYHSDGTSDSITPASTTGTFTGLLFIYHIKGESVLRTTATASVAVGASKLMLATTKKNTSSGADKAYLQVHGGKGETFLGVDNLAAQSITTNKLAANAVDATKVTTGELITLAGQIKDAVIENAKIKNLAVDSAKIANLTVGTGKVAVDAISDVYTATGGAIDFPLTPSLTVLAATISGVVVPADSKVIILGVVQVKNNHAGQWRMPIIGVYRGILSLSNTYGVSLRNQLSTGDKAMSVLSVLHVDYPGTGTFTYNLYGQTWTGYGGGTIAANDTGCNWGRIIAMVVKK